MIVQKVVIKNFKSFKDVELTLNPTDEPNIIIGKNDSGKSNLLDCLDLVNLVQKNKEIESFFNEKETQKIEFHLKVSPVNAEHVERFLTINQLIVIKNRFTNYDENKKYLIFRAFRNIKNEDWKTEISLCQENSIQEEIMVELLEDIKRFTEEEEGLIQKILKEKIKNKDWYLSETQKKAIAKIYIEKDKEIPNWLRGSVLEQIKFIEKGLLLKSKSKHLKMSENIFELKDMYMLSEIKKNPKLQNFILSFLKKQDDKSFIKEKLFGENNLKNERTNVINKCEGLLKKVKISWNNSEIKLSSRIEVESNKIKFQVKEKNSNWFKFSERGSGFKSSLNLIIEKANMEEEKENAIIDEWSDFENTKEKIEFLEQIGANLKELISGFAWKFFLIDEPETHLHPDHQEKVLEEIKKFCQKDKIQIMIATHSPHFICPDKFRNTKILVRRLKGGSEKYKTDIFSNLDDFQKTQKRKNQPYTRAIEIALGYRLKLAFLDEKRKYVVVEGAGDYWLLKAIFKAKNCENFYFHNINSNTKDLTIEYYKMLNLNFIVIFDNDAGGKQKIKNLLKKNEQWIKAQSKHPSFITWELMDENKTDIESFISEKDKEKFCSESKKKADNKKMKVDNRILEKTASIKNWFNQEIDQETRDNFNKIYDWIHKLLKK